MWRTIKLKKKAHQLNHTTNTPPTQPPHELRVLWWAPSHVSLHVKCEMVRPGEGSLAQVALEGPVPCVFAVMTRELIRTGELPPTSLPAAVVGLLTCEHREMKDYSTMLNMETRFLSVWGLCVIAHRLGFIYQEWLKPKLTGVSSEMCLQVGTLGVSFSTAGEAADVRGCAFPRPCASSPLGLGLQELQWGWGRREHHPLCARLEAQAFIIHAKGWMRGVVGHLHLGSLRMVLVSPRCVILLRKVHRLAQLCLAVWSSLVIRAQRRGHVAGCPRWDGHPWLLEGHHTRNVPFLFDFAAALGHHTHNGAVTVHGWLHFDIVQAGEMHRVDIKSPLNTVVARNAIVVGSFGAEQLCHDVGAIWGRRGAVLVVCRVGWHRTSSRVHAVVNCAHIFRRAVWSSCVGENKIQIQVITQVLVVLFAVIVLVVS